MKKYVMLVEAIKWDGQKESVPDLAQDFGLMRADFHYDSIDQSLSLLGGKHVGHEGSWLVKNRAGGMMWITDAQFHVIADPVELVPN